MKSSLFRKSPHQRETLAIDPRALDVAFSIDEVKENEVCDQIAVVSICGPLEHHKSFMWDSYDSILERLEAAFADDSVSGVVMCLDSPGGDAAGATEAHRKIKALRKQYDKPLFAYSNESMYSAAYSIGSAADEIWLPETGGVGSVGVICMLLDKTKQNEKLGLNIKLLTSGARKADSHADRELTDDVVDAMQSRVDYLADVFFKCVAKSRKMTPKAVAALEAGIFMGQDAVDSGLADGVAGWYKFLQYVSDKIGSADTRNVDSSVKNKDAAKELAQMKTITQLKKERDAAEKKLAGARSNAEYKKLFAAFEAAVTTLAAAEITAKTKYVKKTEERLTKDDAEDDEDDDTEESDESEESEESEDDDDTDASEEAEEEAEDKSKKASATAAPSNLSKKVIDKLFSLASKLTGETEASSILGALEGMGPRVRKMPVIEQRLSSLEQKDKRQRVKGILEKAVSERRISPAQARGLEPQGLKDPKWLKGYLAQQPPMVRAVDDALVPDFDAATPSIDNQHLTADQKKMLVAAAQSAGMSVEDYTKEFEKTSSKKPVVNGVTPRY